MTTPTTPTPTPRPRRRPAAPPDDVRPVGIHQELSGQTRGIADALMALTTCPLKVLRMDYAGAPAVVVVALLDNGPGQPSDPVPVAVLLTDHDAWGRLAVPGLAPEKPLSTGLYL